MVWLYAMLAHSGIVIGSHFPLLQGEHSLNYIYDEVRVCLMNKKYF